MELGYIYIIEAGPYFKIGKSINPDFRTSSIVSSMKAHDPKLPLAPIRRIGMCACFRDDLDALEKTLHQRFAAKRVQGEWFTLSTDDLEWIFFQENDIPAMWHEEVLWDVGRHFKNLPDWIPGPS